MGSRVRRWRGRARTSRDSESPRRDRGPARGRGTMKRVRIFMGEEWVKPPFPQLIRAHCSDLGTSLTEDEVRRVVNEILYRLAQSIRDKPITATTSFVEFKPRFDATLAEVVSEVAMHGMDAMTCPYGND